MELSVVIPTLNEESNIGACVGAFAPFVRTGRVEVIVVDNHSTDRTRDLATAAGARVLVEGPERCRQRNCGWQASVAPYVMFVDADMIVPPETTDEILSLLSPTRPDHPDALYVREVRTGRGLRLAARNFERSFYDGTCIDAFRVVARRLLEATGGYDENLVACEDWDLDRRLLAAGATPAITSGHLVHNEIRQDLRRFLSKKAYYSKSIGRYRAKWGEDALMRRQFGLAFRYFGVFVRAGGWRKLLRHPILAAVMMAERLAVGFIYLVHRGRQTEGLVTPIGEQGPRGQSPETSSSERGEA